MPGVRVNATAHDRRPSAEHREIDGEGPSARRPARSRLIQRGPARQTQSRCVILLSTT